MRLEPGATIGQYRIVSLLGKGGAGEIYEAFDTTLERSVALKLLQVGDAERLLREARAASALDHPNIVAVHDVGEDDGRAYVVMPLVRGKTLRERMAEGRVPLEEAIDIASQIASGLAAAHAERIVHRDLKPENVMLAKGGVAKVVDFGIAATTEAASETSEAATMERRVSGTPGYMSPERAEGRAGDARSDIFSFGAVLYELLSGRRAFQGDSDIATLGAVVRDDPETAGLPKPLARIVERALRKDPEARWQSIRDMGESLRDAKLDLMERRRGFGLHVAVAAGALVILGGALYSLWPRSATWQERVLTTLPSAEWDPAISPDGSRVSFAWDGGVEGDPTQLYVQNVDGGADPLQLTKSTFGVRDSAWSPDGQQIAYLQHREDGSHEISKVSALGGEPSHVTSADGRGHGIAWSPDGEYLLFSDGGVDGAPIAIHMFALSSGEKRAVTEPPSDSFGDQFPRLSSEARFVAFSRQETFHGPSRLFVQEIGGAHSIDLGGVGMGGFDWSHDGTTLLVKRGSHVFELSLAGEPSEPFAEIPGARQLASARSSERIVLNSVEQAVDIWRASGPAATSRVEPHRWIASTSTDYFPDYSPDGQRIAFGSRRSGGNQIHVCDASGTGCFQLTEPPLSGSYPRWSPSGRRIAFSGYQDEGNLDIFVVDASGGFPERLTSADSFDGAPAWSPDGYWLYFRSDRTGRDEVFRVPADGGKPEPVTTLGGGVPSFSASSGELFVALPDPRRERARIVRFFPSGPHDSKQPVLERRPHSTEWAVWNDEIVYVDQELAEGPVVVSHDVRTNESNVLHRLGTETVTEMGFSVSRDGLWILFTKADFESDLVLLERTTP